MNIEVYTDGSATVKMKPGGWAYVVVIDGKIYSERSGRAENATNNDMELEAAIQGLMAVKYILNNDPNIHLPSSVVLVSDSQLVLGWASGRYSFKQESKIDKFKQLQLLVSLLGPRFRWVEGHTGDPHNERCDELANLARTGGKAPVKRKKKVVKDFDPKLCSFCGHHEGEGGRFLIVGPMVTICSDCVEVSVEILRKEKERINNG